jgi:VWFA-related protein
MRRVASFALTVLLAILCLVVVRAGLPGQARPRDEQAPIQHQVTVTLKLIQVFVADAAGKPAMDLDKTDFALYDNGKAQTISDFEKHVLAAPAAGLPAPARPAPPVPAGEPSQLLARKFIFLLDYQRNALEGIKKAKTSMLEFIDTKVQPGDELSLYSFSAAGRMTLHEDLTADRAKVRAAVERLRDVPGIIPVGGDSVSLDHEAMGMELINQRIFGAAGGSMGVSVKILFNEIAIWSKVLRAVPGQKNILLYSRGFGGGVVRPGDPNYFAFQTMERELAAANARVFSVNTTTGVVGKAVQGVFPEDSLNHLAATTGGKYFADVNYTTEIASEVQDATASYYVLGFAVPAIWDGKYHNLRVEVRRKGFEVRAQRGYFNPVPFAKLSDIEKHIQLLGLMGFIAGEDAAARRVMEIPLAAAPFAAAGIVNTLVLAELRVTAVREAVGERVEFVLLVLNPDKAIVDGKRLEIDWKSVPSERAFEYAGVALAPGRYDCRAVIRNLDDGRAAVGACTVEVPKPAAEGPSLYPPLFFVRGPAASYVNIESEKIKSEKKAEGTVPFSLSRVFPFPSKECVPLVGPMARGTTFLGVILRCEWWGDRSAEFELDARLFAEESGEEIEIAADVLDKRSETVMDLYLIGVDFPELAPGRYRLEIAAENAATGSMIRASGLFSIR